MHSTTWGKASWNWTTEANQHDFVCKKSLYMIFLCIITRPSEVKKVFVKGVNLALHWEDHFVYISGYII